MGSFGDFADVSFLSINVLLVIHRTSVHDKSIASITFSLRMQQSFSYLKPKSVEELHKNPPTALKELEDEIMKQQFVLEHLHGQIQQMREGGSAKTAAKEETLWAVQAAITMLKRRLKALNEKSRSDGRGERAAKPDGGTTDSPSEDEQTTNFGLLEKQLLAVQTNLREEIAEEKRQIAHLLSVLRELRNKLPEEEQNKMNSSQRQMCDETQKNNSLMSSQNDGTSTAEDKQQQNWDGGDSEENAKWEELCRAEEARRDRLLGELIRYRKICAQLRARLEHDTMLINLLQQQENEDKAPSAAANLLVTRF
ncbi:RalA-binding protein 1 [Globodera pallida]|nr:RalA-binding protein 1 [Globodera pallida]